MKTTRTLFFRTVKTILFLSLAFLPISSLRAQSDSGKAAKNIIIMIGDGMGFNTVELGSLFSNGVLGQQIFDDPSKFPVYLGSTTYMLSGSNAVLNPELAYTEERYWSREDKNNRLLANPDSGAATTNSDAASTAIHTGSKTTDGKMGIDANRNNLVSIAEVASDMGKKTGTVTNVTLADATPAAVGAHNDNRYAFSHIFREMYGNLDVIIGGEDGKDRDIVKVLNELEPLPWKETEANGKTYSLIREKDEFESIANGENLPTTDKVIGVFYKSDEDEANPTSKGAASYDNLNSPDLSTLSLAALNLLNRDEDGFFVMIEGGLIDWRAHSNEAYRTMREQAEFVQSVETVYDWITQNNLWDDTLLIVTADHETGDLWGLGGFETHVSLDSDGMPHVTWGTTGHSNAIVPLWVAGAGSDLFLDYIRGVDNIAADFWSENGARTFSGAYIDNTDIFTVMRLAMERDSAPTPEPATLLILGFGTITLFAARRWKRRN